MFTHSEVLRFFPTLIWSNQIEDAKCIPMNTKFRKKLEDLVSASPDPEYSGMWQTDHDLHTLPELEELNDYIMNATEKVIEFLELKQGNIEEALLMLMKIGLEKSNYSKVKDLSSYIDSSLDSYNGYKLEILYLISILNYDVANDQKYLDESINLFKKIDNDDQISMFMFS